MSWAIWVTGRPGSAGSTVARATADRLAQRGAPPILLELDRIRCVLTPWATHTQAESDVVHRALVFMAVALTEGGVPVLIDTPADHRAWRDLARAWIPRFAAVQLDRPLELEAPPAPSEADLTLDTSVIEVAAAADRIAALALLLEPGAPRAGGNDGAVIWITGPPGSGKTTLAARLAAALAGEGVVVKVLEWAAVRALVLAGSPSGGAAEEIAHRALAYTAKLLAEAGLTVVVDATAPRRAWRALARQLTGTFAEVQLVCPAEICLDRERAVRWGGPCHHGDDTPDVVPEYEYSDNPDLLLDTATRSEWATTEDLLRLARRLLRRRVAG